jgi:hypothetical protein
MSTPLHDMQFVVIDQITMNPKWSASHSVFSDIQDGALLILDPPYAGSDHELTGTIALAETPSGDSKRLEFDLWKVNESGCIGLFFEGSTEEIVPRGTKIVFRKVEQSAAAKP